MLYLWCSFNLIMRIWFFHNYHLKIYSIEMIVLYIDVNFSTRAKEYCFNPTKENLMHLMPRAINTNTSLNIYYMPGMRLQVCKLLFWIFILQNSQFKLINPAMYMRPATWRFQYMHIFFSPFLNVWVPCVTMHWVLTLLQVRYGL